MKRVLHILFALLTIASLAQAQSNVPASSFPTATPLQDDTLYLIKDMGGGTYASRRATIQELDGNVRKATRFSGADAGAKIIAAIADGPSTGVIVDARDLEGGQAISADIWNGVTKPGELWLGAATFTVTAAQQIPSNWVVRGMGNATQLYASSDLANISELSTASAVLYVKANQSHVTIENLYVKGPFTGTGAAGTTFGIYVGSGTSDVTVRNTKVTNASWSGIHLFTGSKLLVEGNYTEHNAVDGIESWATQSQITNNRSYDDAASASGTACIEIIGRQTSPAAVTSDGTIVSDNVCASSNAAGIQLSAVGSGNTTGVSVRNNYIYSPASIAINVQNGHIMPSIENNTIDTTRGSGSLGRGVSIADCIGATVTGNKLRHMTTGSGPNAIEVGGSCYNVQVKNNIIDDAWVGIAVTGTAGTSGTVVVDGNTVTNSASTVDYTVTSSGTRVFAPVNAFGASTITSTLPALTVPTVTGGSAAGDELVLKGTSGNGTSTNPAVEIKVGNNGGTLAARFCNNGDIVINNTNCSLENVTVVDKTFSVRSTTSTDAIMYMINSNGSGETYTLRGRNDGGTRWFDDTDNLPAWGTDGAEHFGVGSLASATANTLCYNSSTITGLLTLSTCSSLRALKEDFTRMPVSLADFMKLHPWKFRVKASGEHRIGFVAEEVHDVNPMLASYYKGELNGVDYSALTALTVDIVQQQELRIEQLEKALQVKRHSGLFSRIINLIR